MQERASIDSVLTGSGRDVAHAGALLSTALEAELDVDVAVLLDRGDGWQLLAGSLSGVLDGADPTWGEADGHHLLEPVRVGALRVTLLTLDKPVDPLVQETARQGCVWVGLHALTGDAVREVDAANRETDVLRAVSEQLRSVRDLDQVLLSITRSTLDLLESDICGVLLREGETLVMRSCVGNRVAETSRLRMRRGQGVAGLVFETGRPGKVDDYVTDSQISQDFVALAEHEAARTALAVPLMLHQEIIGVLEVWRRRASTFTDRDVQRLVTLADFASIAIDNATLYARQHTMLGELEDTRTALEGEVRISRSASQLQDAILDAVLRSPTVGTVAGVVSRELHCNVGIYGVTGDLERSCLADESLPLPDSVSLQGPAGPHCQGSGRTAVWEHPIVVGSDVMGVVVLTGLEQSAELVRVAAGQTALACALAHVQQSAASRARAEALDQALWDLLEGPLEHRTAVRGRIHQMGVDLGGHRQVFLGRVVGTGDGADGDGSALSKHHVANLRALRQVLPSHARNALLGVRGDCVVAVVPPVAPSEVRSVTDAWNRALREVDDGLRVTWGVSGSTHTGADLERAYDEASIALTAATRMGVKTVSLFDELGIVRLLLGTGSEPDVKAFIDDVTGPLLAYDRDHDGQLVLTLRTFFDANCSQKTAADRLFIHHKTMRYRLERIKQLTGLDLAQHQDRVRADVALRILQVSAYGQD